MLIKAYGLFWRADEVNWQPGRGSRGEFMLLGRRGKNRPNLQLANFRRQSGIYILYSDYGPYYVGLARENSLGRRLKGSLSQRPSRGQMGSFLVVRIPVCSDQSWCGRVMWIAVAVAEVARDNARSNRRT